MPFAFPNRHNFLERIKMKSLTLCTFFLTLMTSSSVTADIIVHLFRTGDATKNSAFSVAPGEVFSVDAEITSTGTDELNTYFAPFLVTPLAASTATFTDQTAVPLFRNSASNYVFGDAELLGDTTVLNPFASVFDGSLLPGTSVSVGATPLLLSRMEFVADVLAVPGESILIDFDPLLLGGLPAFSQAAGSPIAFDMSNPANVTFAAVPEPSALIVMFTAAALFAGYSIRKRHPAAPPQSNCSRDFPTHQLPLNRSR